jgi:transposase
MEGDIEVRLKQRCVIEFLNGQYIAPIELHQLLKNFYGEQTVDISTVRHWIRCVSDVGSGLKDMPRSGRPCTAVTEENKKRVNQLILQNRSITTRELHAAVGIGFNALHTILKKLGFRKLCARWVPCMFTGDHKEQRLQACADLLEWYESLGDDFLDNIVTRDETWVHHYEPKSKQ